MSTPLNNRLTTARALDVYRLLTRAEKGEAELAQLRADRETLRRLLNLAETVPYAERNSTEQAAIDAARKEGEVSETKRWDEIEDAPSIATNSAGPMFPGSLLGPHATETQKVLNAAWSEQRPMLPEPVECGTPCGACEALAHDNARLRDELRADREKYSADYFSWRETVALRESEVAQLKREKVAVENALETAVHDRDYAEREVARLQAEIERWRESNNRLRSGMEHQSLRANTAEHEIARLNQRILDDNKAYGCDLRDPSGTIWKHAAKLQSEVARLQMQVDSMCDAEQLRQEREARKKAEAEVERLREEVKHSHNEVAELLVIAKAWALVWGDKLSKESLAQFEALENGILARAAKKAAP